MAVTPLASADFNRWIKTLFKRTSVFFPVLCAASSFVVGTYTLMTRIVEHPLFRVDTAGFRTGLFAFHVLVCLFLLFLIPKPRTDAAVSPRAAMAIEQFIEAWERLWLCWVLLYLVFCAKEISEIVFGPEISDSPYWRLGLNVVNNLQTMVLVMIYLVIAKSTVDPARMVSRLPWNRGFAIFACVTMINCLATAMHLLTPETHPWHLFVNGTCAAMGWASAIGSGASMALVVGRLDSKFSNPPTWSVLLLYLYALIQVVWVQFDESRVVETVMISAALVLKCLLFLVVAWLLHSGVMFFYLDRLAYLIVHVENERNDYLRKLNGSLEMAPRRTDLQRV